MAITFTFFCGVRLSLPYKETSLLVSVGQLFKQIKKG